jgi:hypothetical protein
MVLTDVLAFERPIRQARLLTLELPRRNLGEQGQSVIGWW